MGIEALQMEDVVEPSQELERDDSHAGEVLSGTVSQVMELMEDRDPLVPSATGGSITTRTLEFLTSEKPVAELELEYVEMEATVTSSSKGKK